MDSIADTFFDDLLEPDACFDSKQFLQNLWIQYQGCRGDATQENILSAQIRDTQRHFGIC